MERGSVCGDCHQEGEENGKYGATLVGAAAAREMKKGLDDLKQQIADAK